MWVSKRGDKLSCSGYKSRDVDWTFARKANNSADSQRTGDAKDASDARTEAKSEAKSELKSDTKSEKADTSTSALAPAPTTAASAPTMQATGRCTRCTPRGTVLRR